MIKKPCRHFEKCFAKHNWYLGLPEPINLTFMILNIYYVLFIIDKYTLFVLNRSYIKHYIAPVVALNDPTVDTHMLVVGFRKNKGKMPSLEKGVCFSKTAAQTRRQISYLVYNIGQI